MLSKGIVHEDEYYGLEGYTHYSLIKSVSEKGNRAFTPKPQDSIKTQKTFDTGHILERYFLEDKDLSYIKIDNTKELTGHSLTLFKALLDYLKDNELKSIRKLTDSFILAYVKELELWSNIKNEEKLLPKFKDIRDNLKFYVSLKKGDVIANPEVFNIISEADKGLNSFNEVRESLYPSTKCKIINQYTIISDDIGLGLPVKGRLDRVHIDHKNKVIDIIDFKTTQYHADQFLTSFYQFKYYYQLPFYTRLFQLANPEFSDYTYNMKFVVISKTSPEIPAVYILDPKWMESSWNGWTSKKGYTFKGIYELLEEIKWYREEGASLPREMALNQNILRINLDE